MSRAAIWSKIPTLIGWPITAVGLARVVCVACLACPACSGKREPPEPAPVAPVAPITPDAGPAGTTVMPGYDPASGMHLDEDGTGAPRPATRPHNRPSRPVEVMLRSTPTGAIAAVDNVQLGPTPTYWFGDADGREHEFTFVRPGYTVARYRFVPVQSGLIHARLEPVGDDHPDGGLGVEVAPVFTPDAAAVSPPPTVITPSAPPAPPAPAPPAIDASPFDAAPAVVAPTRS